MSVDAVDRCACRVDGCVPNLLQDGRLWRAHTSDDCTVVSIHSGLRHTWLYSAVELMSLDVEVRCCRAGACRLTINDLVASDMDALCNG